MEGWVEREIEGCEFPDERLKTRFGKLLGQLGEKIGAALPTACQDWAATKAAYRFFDNPRVDESIILAGHFAATKSRMAAAKGPILILHDTTEFSFQRERPEAIGKTQVLPSARIGQQADHQVRAADAFQPGDHHCWQAAGAGGRQVLDPQEVQGDQRTEGPWQRGQQALSEHHADSDRREREHSLAGES